MQRFAILALLSLPLCAANLVQNPGFEDPVLSGTFLTFTGANTIPSWQWAGPGAGLLLRNDYSEGPLLFPAHSGQNSLDMTGPGWTGNNVIYQDITTVIGQMYTLSFWLGNQSGSGSYSAPSSIGLSIGGGVETEYSNSNTNGTTVQWTQYTQSFVANALTTRIAFRNTTSPTDAMNGLDDVFVDVAASQVPEPATVLPVAAALLLCATRLRSRIR